MARILARRSAEPGRQRTDPAEYRTSEDLLIKHRRHRGIGLIWSIIFLILIILLIGLSLDVAKVCLVTHQLHNAADAAALAGAVQARLWAHPEEWEDPLGPRQRAQFIGQQNVADGSPVLLDLNEDNDPNGDIVIGWYNLMERTFDPVEGPNEPANAMAVITSRTQDRLEMGGPVSLNFGHIADVDTVDVTSRWQTKRGPYAIAVAMGGTGAGLIALEPWDTGVAIGGTGELNVMPIPPALPGDGEVQINSAGPEALHVDGGPDIIASALNITGEIDVGNYDLTVPFNVGVPPLPDPLAWLQPPAYNELDDLTAATKAMVGDTSSWAHIAIADPDYDPNTGEAIPWQMYPGYYAGGFRISGNDDPDHPSVYFNPGVYVIGGTPEQPKPSGIVVGSQAFVVANEATFYITRNTSGDYGIVDIQAGAGFTAIEPTSGYYAGVTFFQDRANFNPVEIHGSGNLDLEGTLYFPSADPIYLRGGGDGFGNQIIGLSFDIWSTTYIGIEYDGRNRAPTTGSFIVE